MAWYAWHWADYERDTLHLTLEQDAIYRRMIDWYTSHQSPIPDNDQSIATICRISSDKWGEHSEVIRAFFKPRNGKLHLKLCDAQIADQKRRSEERIAHAKRAAEVRWGKKEENQEDECTEHAGSNAQTMPINATNKPNQPTYKDYKPTNQQPVNGFLHASGLVNKVRFSPSLETCQKLRDITPGWDQNMLLEKYNSWKETNGMANAENPDAAFLGWAKKFTKGQRPR